MPRSRNKLTGIATDRDRERSGSSRWPWSAALACGSAAFAQAAERHRRGAGCSGRRPIARPVTAGPATAARWTARCRTAPICARPARPRRPDHDHQMRPARDRHAAIRSAGLQRRPLLRPQAGRPARPADDARSAGDAAATKSSCSPISCSPRSSARARWTTRKCIEFWGREVEACKRVSEVGNSGGRMRTLRPHELRPASPARRRWPLPLCNGMTNVALVQREHEQIARVLEVVVFHRMQVASARLHREILLRPDRIGRPARP